MRWFALALAHGTSRPARASLTARTRTGWMLFLVTSPHAVRPGLSHTDRSIPLKHCTASFLWVNAATSYMPAVGESKPEPFFRLATNDLNFCFLPVLSSVPADLSSQLLQLYQWPLRPAKKHILFLSAFTAISNGIWEGRVDTRLAQSTNWTWKLSSLVFKLRMFVYEVLLQKDMPPNNFRKAAIICRENRNF